MRTESGDPLMQKYSNACPPGELVTKVKRMTRAELEDFVMAKIVQILLYETEEGKFKRKIMELENHKEMLKSRVDTLNKQVSCISYYFVANTVIEYVESTKFRKIYVFCL